MQLLAADKSPLGYMQCVVWDIFQSELKSLPVYQVLDTQYKCKEVWLLSIERFQDKLLLGRYKPGEGSQFLWHLKLC